MNKLESRWLELRSLDELASQASVVHDLNPTAKLLVTLAYIVTATSYAKYDIIGLVPLLVYPAAMMSLGRIPAGMLGRRVLILLPFVLFVGILNPLFDQAVLVQAGPIAVSGGMISFLSIILRFVLSVTAVLILIATTGMEAVCASLAGLGVPKLLISQILLLYRYLYVLLEEVLRVSRAYTLRSPYQEGVAVRAWGSLAGSLLLRTLERAQRIHQAMLCRGFDGDVHMLRRQAMNKGDVIFLVVWGCFFLAARLYNLPHLLGQALLGGVP